MNRLGVLATAGVVAAILALAGCAPTVDVTEDITAPTEWKVGTYVISSSLTVSAALTIPAGSTLEFAADAYLYVDANGSITAIGTEQKPITFTAAAGTTAGDWNGVEVDGSGSTFTYCTFAYADTGLNLDGASTSVTNCAFNNNTYGLDGVDAGTGTVITSNTFEGNEEPLFIDASYDVDASNTFTGNTNQRIYFYWGDVEADRSWSETEVPYYMYGSTSVASDTFTIAAGVTLAFAADTYLYVGPDGVLSAVGTETLPITFTSGVDTQVAGQWNGVEVDGSGSVFDYCTFAYADTGLNLDGASTSVTNCAFNNNTYGLDGVDAGTGTVITSNTFEGNEEPLFINASYDVDASNTFTGNTNQRIYFYWGDVEADRSWSETEVPYYMSGSTSVTSGIFTIAAGVTLAFAADTYLYVGPDGAVDAVGTETLSITFTSGVDIPVAGQWNAVEVDGSGSTFTYCAFAYADTGLDVDSVSITVTSCDFNHNTIGLDLYDTTWNDYSFLTFSNNGTDVYDPE